MAQLENDGGWGWRGALGGAGGAVVVQRVVENQLSLTALLHFFVMDSFVWLKLQTGRM